MGQKVSPHGLRVGIIKDWGSKWYADKNNFADYLIEDNKVREFVKKKLYAAGVSKVVIERPEENKIKIIIATGRPGMVIGRSGDGIEQLKADLVKLTGKTVDIDIREVRRAELDAQLTAESIAQALERRIAFRRAMKQAIGRTMKANAKGIKVLVSGREVEVSLSLLLFVLSANVLQKRFAIMSACSRVAVPSGERVAVPSVAGSPFIIA